jgi:hypothetical protein
MLRRFLLLMKLRLNVFANPLCLRFQRKESEQKINLEKALPGSLRL